MSSHESRWWLELVACPYCGTDEVDLCSTSRGISGACRCGREYRLKDRTLFWDGGDSAGERSNGLSARTLWKKLWNSLNPLNNPLLPMRHFSRWRVEQYYRRTLSDIALARTWAEHFLKDLSLPDGATVLDFGCGRGRNIGFLKQLGYKVVGQDVISNKWWDRLPDVGFQVLDTMARLPWKDASFDLVVEVEVIHYLPWEALQKHVEEIRRIIKPGGYWVLLEANNSGDGAEHIRRQIGQMHPLGEVRSLMESEGFMEIDIDYISYYASHFPLFINFLRQQCSLRRFDMYDWNSWLASRVPKERRGLWLMRLQRTSG